MYHDINGNGTEDAGEPGLSGVTVIANPGGHASVSNQNGDYLIYVGDPDTFTVEVQIPSRYYCSGTVQMNDTLTAPPGIFYTAILTQVDSVSSNNDFGLKLSEVACGTINGYVFYDTNGNGIDDGEPRKEGILVQFSTGQRATTDFAGMYSIEVPLNVSRYRCNKYGS